MEQKPLELIRDLQAKNAALEKTKKRLEYQIQEMVTKSAQRCAEIDQKISELEIQIRNLEYDNRELKAENRQLLRRFKEKAPSSSTNNNNNSSPHGSIQVIQLEDDEKDDEEVPHLLDQIPSRRQSPFEEPVTRYSEFEDFPGQPIVCHICNKSYVHKKRFDTHMKMHQNLTKTSASPVLQSSRAAVPVGRTRSTHKCPHKDCTYSTTFYPAMVRHEKTHTAEQLSCDFYMCDYKTSSRKRYYNHMASKHGANMTGNEMDTDNAHSIEDDDEQFEMYSDLNDHIISSSMHIGNGDVVENEGGAGKKRGH